MIVSGCRASAQARVVGALCGNAVEHGAGTIDGRLRRVGDDVHLQVADDGSGPPPGTVDGLRLTIVRALVSPEPAAAPELAARAGGRAAVTFPAESLAPRTQRSPAASRRTSSDGHVLAWRPGARPARGLVAEVGRGFVTR